jgi:hypothetical protein
MAYVSVGEIEGKGNSSTSTNQVQIWPSSPAVSSFILMETGDFLLLETNDKILME